MNNSRRQAFTLIEILLVIVILMMFIGSAIYYMSPALHAVKLEEGCARLQSMLKFASAEASQTGKRVRISFASTNDTAGNTFFVPKVFMEMNPISAPGEYTLMPEVTWLDAGILDLVNLQMVQRSEESEDEEDEESEEDGDAEEEETLSERLAESDSAVTTTVSETSGDSAESSGPDSDDSSESKSSNGSSSKKSSTSSSAKISSAKSADIPLALTNKNEFYSAMEGNIVDGGTKITGDDSGSESEELDEALEDAEALEETDISILFYPDGSSDSVILKLASVDEEDTRQAILYLNGITGFVELRYVQTNSDSDSDENEEDSDEETEEDAETEGNIDAANEAMVGDGESFYGGSEGSSKSSSGRSSGGSSSGNSGNTSDSKGTLKKINLE